MRRPLDKNVIGAGLLVAAYVVLDAMISLTGMRENSSLVTDRAIPSLLLLLATLLVTGLYDRMPFTWVGLGIHRWLPRELLSGIALGIGMALIAWLPLLLLSTVDLGSGRSLQLLFWGRYFIAGALLEELLFRGYLYQRAIEILGPLPATLLSSLLFTLAHINNPGISVFAVVNIFLAGIFFSLCYLRTGSLWLPIAAHTTWNFVLAKICGVSVSGLDFGSAFLQTTSTGPAVITGGSFGPEGGAVATVALICGGYMVAKSSLIHYSPFVYADVFKRIFQVQVRRCNDSQIQE